MRDAEPRRVAIVLGGPGEPEVAFEEAAAARRVHEPAAADRSLLPRALQRDAVAAHGIHLEIDHTRRVDDLDAIGSVHLGEGVLEPATIQLPGRYVWREAWSKLYALPEVAVAVAGEEIADAVFGQVRLLEIRTQPEHMAEVVGADLDRRFTDLERGLSDGKGVLLDNEE